MLDKLSDKMFLEHRAINKWTSIRDRCLEKGLDFDLTVADVRRLISRKKCFYTDIDMQLAYDSGQTHHCRSIDRVDSSKGYVRGNVVACSMAVNKLKSDLTIDDIEKMLKRWKGFEEKRKD